MRITLDNHDYPGSKLSAWQDPGFFIIRLGTHSPEGGTRADWRRALLEDISSDGFESGMTTTWAQASQ